MIPEATLMAILVIVFIADFASNGKQERRWFNPMVNIMLVIQLIVCLFFLTPTSAFGGMYVASSAANVMKAIITLGALIVTIQSGSFLNVEQNRSKEGEYYMILISTLLGMYVMMSAGHFLLFFLGLEMASVPMACLVAIDTYSKKSAEAAAKFVLTATFSSAVMLYGISFLYGSTGTLYFADFSMKLAFSAHSTLNIVGLIFFIAGLGFKLSLVPFHFWTADTYEGAPTPVTGYLSVVSKGAAAFTLVTILMKAFSFMTEEWQLAMYILIVLSITVANLMAIRQSELKRFMAFSSISQAGYIMLAVVADNAMGVTALSYYVLVYVVANMAVFTVINAVELNSGGRTDMAVYDGLYKTNPKFAFLMTLALFSLAGIPPFAGMFSKFFVFMAALKQGTLAAYIVVLIALVNTVVSLYYYLLIVKAMYINNDGESLPTFKSDYNTRLSLIICTAGVLLLGVASFVYEWINAASL